MTKLSSLGGAPAGRPLLENGSDIEARFEIEALAGAGGMGRVYRARDRATGAIVALKLLTEHGDPDRLAREARLLAELDHPAIVRYLEAGTTASGTPFISMEWLAGQDLDDRIARGRLTIDEVIVLAKRLAEALAAAHQRGIVHRDLKPGNVLLCDGDVARAKVIDFGLARQEGDVVMTADGAVIGTPSFMSPEQIRGERVDPRADVYGLGAVLFNALVGRPPFAGPNRVAVLAKAIAEPPPRPSDLRPEVPAAFDDIVLRLLAKDRDDRPRDGGEVVRLLADLTHAAHAPRQAQIAVTAREQRIACIVLCGGGGERSDLTIKEGRPEHTGLESGMVPSPETLGEAVFDLGGTLHPLTRETSLVTIRTSTSPYEQAARAARCALAMQRLRPDAPFIVATGQVVEVRGTQVGEVIDRATSQLFETTAPRSGRGIRIDAPTAELIAERFTIRGEGPWRDLVGEEQAAASSRTFLGKPSACVGRASELASLETALAECISEPRSRAVLIVAPPGIGKSRLVEAFRDRVAAGLTADVLGATGDALRVASSFHVAAQLIHAKAGVSDIDPPETRRVNISSMLERIGASADSRRLDALLGEIAGAYTSSVEAPPMLLAARRDAALMADVTREAWIAWLAAMTDRRPVVLTIEDIQWADHASIQLIDAALGELADRPLLVVATARPEIGTLMSDLFRKRSLVQIHLGPLPAKAARAFVEHALGPAASVSEVDSIVDRASGHPFFLEELVRRVASGRDPRSLPTSILGMMQARFDDLDPYERRVLRAASVFGQTFTAEGVAALLGEAASSRDVVSRLRSLVDHELLQRRPSGRAPGEVEHAFRHALLCDAAYAMLMDRDRSLAHQLAAEWLEARGEPEAAVVAEHYHRGGAPQRALPHFRKAAKIALARCDLDRAEMFAERAMACGPDEAAKGALLATEAEVSYWRGDLDAASDRASSASSLLEPGSPAWFDAAAAAVGALGQRGKNDEVAKWLVQIAKVESTKEARGAHVVALCRGLAQLVWAHSGDLESARARLDRVAEPIDELNPLEAGWVHRVRAEASWIFDRNVDACLSSFEASARSFERAHARRFLCLVQMNHASLRGWSGDVDAALELAAAARRDAEKMGWRFLADYGLAVTGMLEAFAGSAGSEATLRRALSSLGGSPRLSFICHTLVAWLALDRDDPDTAEKHVEIASRAAVVAELAVAGRALRARLLARRGNLDEALEEARKACDEGRALPDLELFEGLADAALVKVHELRADGDAARSVAHAAHSRLLAIAATIGSADRRAQFKSRGIALRELFQAR